jgi:hypothetical protein
MKCNEKKCYEMEINKIDEKEEYKEFLITNKLLIF